MQELTNNQKHAMIQDRLRQIQEQQFELELNKAIAVASGDEIAAANADTALRSLQTAFDVHEAKLAELTDDSA